MSEPRSTSVTPTARGTSVMITAYRRHARHAAELGLGYVVPMDEAMPELAVEPCSAHPTPSAAVVAHARGAKKWLLGSAAGFMM